MGAARAAVVRREVPASMCDTRRSAAEPSGRVCESRSESVRFIADFCCLEHRLKIELDGGQHACELEKEKDEARTDFSEKTGDTRVLRFWDHEVFQETELVLQRIADLLAARDAE